MLYTEEHAGVQNELEIGLLIDTSYNEIKYVPIGYRQKDYLRIADVEASL